MFVPLVKLSPVDTKKRVTFKPQWRLTQQIHTVDTYTGCTPVFVRTHEDIMSTFNHKN